jgi:hypothetical protein
VRSGEALALASASSDGERAGGSGEDGGASGNGAGGTGASVQTAHAQRPEYGGG